MTEDTEYALLPARPPQSRTRAHDDTPRTGCADLLAELTTALERLQGELRSSFDRILAGGAS